MSYIIETTQGYVPLEILSSRFTTDIGEARCFTTEEEANAYAVASVWIFNNHPLEWKVAPRFVNTLAALDIWAAKSPERAKAWHIDNLTTNADVNFAIALDKEHEIEVQEAFYKDTSTINSRDNCGLVSIHDLIRMSGWRKS